ncbi:MAG: hypothetical protein L6R41_001761 [Letrouitia leprolyta]|nr:MAG: hypothetical protein L6R41_001761 [Letrouitia leprolyta]
MSSTKFIPETKPSFRVCQHEELLTESSPHAAETGFRRPIHKNAASKSRKRKRSRDDDVSAQTLFPAPLVLPGDDLALDPQHPAQSVRSWQRDKDRNIVTPERNAIYVASPPEIDPGVQYLDSWIHPKVPGPLGRSGQPVLYPNKDINPFLSKSQNIIDYLSAFYHPLPVKPIPSPLTFTAWDFASPEPKPSSTSCNSRKSRKLQTSHIALRTSTELIRIRTRSSPDSSPFPAQLNLDDLLDVAISLLPSDAYALLLLVFHDLYESEEDIFVCGRAYGGSRVAVVSSARYNPDLDYVHHLDHTHAWPASHCRKFLEACSTIVPLSSNSRKSKDEKAQNKIYARPDFVQAPGPPPHPQSTPLYLALHRYIANAPSGPLLYLTRLCLTSAHELGHCFGLDHCVYYACCMQGSASLAEDARQPPYLCPMCEEKVLLATGADGRERMRKLKELCERWAWESFGGWLEGMLALEG